MVMDIKNIGDKPLVSVLITSYNHADYIEQAILSVIEQDYGNIQLVVTDGNSTDGSVGLLRGLQEKYDFELLLNDVNLGVQKNLIRGFDRVRGKYINLMASDEIIANNKISEQLSFILGRDIDGVLGSHFDLYTNKDCIQADMKDVVRLFEKGAMLNSLYVSDTVGPLVQSGLFKTEIFSELMPYRTIYKSDDWAILIKIFEKYKIGFLDKPFMYYRITTENAHKNYWKTLPMRLEVVSCVAPVEKRFIGMSNIFESMAEYLLCDGRRGGAVKFFLASFVFDPGFKKFFRFGSRLFGFLYRKLNIFGRS
ncbi:glycosyltransferase family 2 protein [Castellaniella sp.]|uniref:glycosyltransferase family 2 protein n=1 Tax=Castellaniella sp. TaxID=1955812 RepID=UPI002AFF4521|nr:glycosyltransferase family 2 protein [Castellaniella sp.]